MIHLGDITKINFAPPVNCITFGSPCQDLSIAGKRAGLAGGRSGLFMDAVRVIENMYLATMGMYPQFAVWENVPGAFSSNKGEDFHAVLEELARIKEHEVSIPRPENGKWAKAGFICGNGWSIAWRTFDAQFWGVPQRRRRIALVLDLRGQRAGEILFERTGVSGNPEPSIPPWKGVARNPESRVAGHDRVVETAIPINTQIATRHISLGERTGMGWGEDGDPAYTLQAGHEHAVLYAAYPDTARALTARHDGSPCVDRGPNVVCLQGNMIDRDVQQNGSGVSESETMFTLNATDRHGVCVKSVPYQEATGPLMANSHPGSYCGQDAYSNMLVTCKEVFESHSQDARYTQQGDTSTACTAQWGTGGNNMPLVVFSKEAYNTGENAQCSMGITTDETTPTMRADTHPSGVAYLSRCILRWIVRRLTPTECERLQGFPDGWTDIGDWTDSKGKRHKAADSPRYKALGNSIALPQWWWITCKMAQYLPEHATLGSLFDGIGGFPLVWETRHGKGTAVWASEIEEFPIAVTKKHFGGTRQ